MGFTYYRKKNRFHSKLQFEVESTWRMMENDTCTVNIAFSMTTLVEQSGTECMRMDQSGAEWSRVEQSRAEWIRVKQS